MPAFTQAPDKLVKVDGAVLDGAVNRFITELTYDNQIEAADMFSITLSNADFRFTDSRLFEVGRRVEIFLGYVGALAPVMLGEITGLAPSFPSSGVPTLTISGYDLSHRLRHNRPKPFTSRFERDSAVVRQIAEENGLEATVEEVPTASRSAETRTDSDWALLRKLADRNGFQVFVRGTRLHFRAAPPPSSATVTLEWGRNLSSFTPRLSTAAQAGLQEVRGLDSRRGQDVITRTALDAVADTVAATIGRLGTAVIDRVSAEAARVGLGESVQDFADAEILAKVKLQRNLERLYEASGTCPGRTDLRAGEVVRIAGVGQRFSGLYRLTRVSHQFGDGGYQTSFEVAPERATLGQSLRREMDNSPSAPERHGRYDHVLIGRIVNNTDRIDAAEVEISLPALSDQDVKLWARLAMPWSGDGHGCFFVPNPDDAVVVAFEGGDINKPIVIGALWQGAPRPPADGAARVATIRSRSGLAVVMEEDRDGDRLTLQDKDGGSTIVLDAKSGDIRIRARNNVTIESGDGFIDFNP